jgi:hypothetical protein
MRSLPSEIKARKIIYVAWMAHLQGLLPQYFSAFDMRLILIQFEKVDPRQYSERLIEEVLMVSTQKDLSEITDRFSLVHEKSSSSTKLFFFIG